MNQTSLQTLVTSPVSLSQSSGTHSTVCPPVAMACASHTGQTRNLWVMVRGADLLKVRECADDGFALGGIAAFEHRRHGGDPDLDTMCQLVAGIPQERIDYGELAVPEVASFLFEVCEQAYVLQRVAVHRDDVREVSGFDTADPVVPADQFGCMDGGRLDRAERALAAADLVGELAGVEAVRVDAAVGTECDAHASRQALGESFSLREGRLVVLAENVGTPALFAAGLSDVVTVVDIGDQERPGSGHHLD